MTGRYELLVIALLAVYLIFAWQLADLLRARRYGAFLIRLLLAPLILLFDWPVRRDHRRGSG